MLYRLRIIKMLTRTNIACCNGLKHYCRLFCSQPKPRDVILFPGQGTQFVSMTANLIKMPVVKQLFGTANKILGYNLLELCLNGPKTELDRTVYCQPAVFVASLAALEKYKEMHGKGWFDERNIVTAGYSVGELAALVLSKALTFEDGLRLVDIRAKAMQHASDENPSGMVTVAGLTEEETEEKLKSVRALCKEDVEISIANFLHSKGFVVAGERTAINNLLKLPHNGVNGQMSELAVSGAFHTPLMKYAQPFLSQALDSMDIRTPQIEVYSNVTGQPYQSIEDIKKLLPRQVVEQVQWRRILGDILRESKYDQTFYEIGPGRQLTAILAKIDRKLIRKCKNVEA